jgi:multidrug efflux pump subunit AcrA (membrane-fusion protein)
VKITVSRGKAHDVSPAESTAIWGGCLLVILLGLLPSCGRVRAKGNSQEAVTVGVTTVSRKSLQRQITLSSELVPFQEIDVYAKEAGYVQKLYVDYGTHVRQGQLMAVLEIPELEAQLQEDQAAIKNATEEVSGAEHILSDMNGVLHMVGSSHLGVVTLHDGVVLRIAKGVFDPAPHLAARNGIGTLVGLAEHR